MHGEVVLLEEQVPKSIAAMSAFESNGLDSAVASRAVDEGHVVRIALEPAPDSVVVSSAIDEGLLVR